MRRLVVLLVAALVGVALTVLPSHAAAGLSVTAPSGARVEIQQDPFRLAFVTAAGATALSEVTPTANLPQVEPPTVDPVPPGLDSTTTTTRYAPLSYTVGTETLTQQPAGEWIGNLLSGQRSGVQYAAQDVVAEHAVPGGVQLTLSTDEPTGRHLVATITSAGIGGLRVHVVADPPDGVSEIGDSFASSADEQFYGFGGRHNSLTQRGQVISNFVNEQNQDGGTGLTMLPNGVTAAYYPQAIFYSSHPYGFYDDQAELVRFKLAVDRPDAWNVTASTSALDYVVAPGAATTAIGTLTALSGRQQVPPQWGLGPELDRLQKIGTETQADYEANLASDIANLDRYRIPVTSYRIEGWGFDGKSDNDGLSLHTFVTPAYQAKIIAELKARGIHPLAYVRPWLVPGEHDDLAVTDGNGKAYEEDADVGSNVDLIDFTKPAARAYWNQVLGRIFDLGFDGMMQDYGESVLFDMHFADGSTGVTEHNAYLPKYDAATRSAITAYQATHPGRSFFFFTRAGDSGSDGSLGSAASENANFPGDETTDFTHTSGLASLTADMLNRAIGGAYGYGTDIGGYADYPNGLATDPQHPTSKELFLRWAEWAALSPVMRLHGSAFAGTHAPWTYDQQTVDAYRALSQLHLQAAPLIMALWREASSDGLPPTRPLWLQYPADPEAAKADQEWLLGPDVLVAPVVTQGATSRDVYFPAGCWSRQGADEVHTTAGHATVPATLLQLPYYVRCGSHPFTPTTTPTATAPPTARSAGALAATGGTPWVPWTAAGLVAVGAVVRGRRRGPGRR